MNTLTESNDFGVRGRNNFIRPFDDLITVLMNQIGDCVMAYDGGK